MEMDVKNIKGLCVLSLTIYLMMIMRMCIFYLIIIMKSKVWRIGGDRDIETKGVHHVLAWRGR